MWFAIAAVVLAGSGIVLMFFRKEYYAYFIMASWPCTATSLILSAIKIKGQ